MNRTQALITAAIAKTPNKSANQLARCMGVTVQAVHQWKKGRTKPGLYACGKLAEFLEKPFEEIAAAVTSDHLARMHEKDVFICTRPGGCAYALRTREPAKTRLASRTK